MITFSTMFRATRKLANLSKLSNARQYWATVDGFQLWCKAMDIGAVTGMVTGAIVPDKGDPFINRVGGAAFGTCVGIVAGAASPVLVPSAIVAGAVHLFK
jgi:hypothetical protein